MKKILRIVLIIVILIVLVFFAYKIAMQTLYPRTYSEYVDKYSEKYGMESEWIYALIKAESNFEPESVSTSGAIRSYANNGKYCS